MLLYIALEVLFFYHSGLSLWIFVIFVLKHLARGPQLRMCRHSESTHLSKGLAQQCFFLIDILNHFHITSSFDFIKEKSISVKANVPPDPALEVGDMLNSLALCTDSATIWH